MKRGKFIVFEGIDGSGKSTQVWMLARYLSDLNKYNHVLLTREPWKNTDIRKILQEDEDPYSRAKKLAELFTDDRREHCKKVILPQIREGVHVISDRYSFSTLVYQKTQGVPLSELLKMHKGLLIPDLIFIIDVPVETAFKRMKKDSKRELEQKFEKNKTFVEKLRKNYISLKDLKNHRVVVIDGRKKPDEIFEEIKKHLDF